MISCLPTYSARCSSLALTPCSSVLPSRRGFRHTRVLDPERLPQRDRLVGGLRLALVERLRLAGVAAGEFGVQMGDGLADQLGDRRAVARPHLRRRQCAELVEDCLIGLADVGKRQRLHPPRRRRRVGKCEFGRIRGFRRRNVRLLLFGDRRTIDGVFLHAALQHTASTVDDAGARPFGQSSKNPAVGRLRRARSR